jgi:transposase
MAMPTCLGEIAVRRLQIEEASVMRIAIQQEISRSEESRYDHRLHGLLLVCNGQSCVQVADLFGEDRRTIQRWVTRFEALGLEGLREGERPGRPQRLSPQQWERLERELRGSPRELRFAQTMWDGKLLSEHLRRHYKVKLGVRQCQRLFAQLGFRQRKPRPMVGKADIAAQRAFKKNCADWPTIQGLNCGAWTNATSNSTAPARACGSRRRSKTRCCGTRPRASRWPALAQSSTALANWSLL